MAILFPPLLLREQSVSWRIIGGIVSPGMRGDGVSTVIRHDGGGLWACDLTSIALTRKEHIQAWRAVEALCEGGAVPIVVPMCDKRHAPFPTVNGTKLYQYGSISHSDGSLFSDGTGYYQPVIVATAAAAALRAATLTVTFDYGGPCVGGEYLSINHAVLGWRLYRVRSASESDLSISPPLREAITDDTIVEFDVPRCTMRLRSPDAMNLDLQMRQRGAPSATFIEHFE